MYWIVFSYCWVSSILISTQVFFLSPLSSLLISSVLSFSSFFFHIFFFCLVFSHLSCLCSPFLIHHFFFLLSLLESFISFGLISPHPVSSTLSSLSGVFFFYFVSSLLITSPLTLLIYSCHLLLILSSTLRLVFSFVQYHFSPLFSSCLFPMFPIFLSHLHLICSLVSSHLVILCPVFPILFWLCAVLCCSVCAGECWDCLIMSHAILRCK